MSIPLTRYVEIISRVAGGAAVSGRNLGLRVFTTNPLVPVNQILEFSTSSEVLGYFGSASEEYKRALQYFNFISKQTTRAKLISFVRWADAAFPASIIGASLTTSIAEFQAVTDGSLSLTVGGSVLLVPAIDLSTEVSLTDVATALQAAIITAGTGDTQFTGCTVVFDATRGAFVFTAGDAGDFTVSAAPGATGTDLTTLVGWTPQISGAIWGSGSTIQSVTELLSESSNASNNFGSFVFTATPVLTNAEIVEAATWNLGKNVSFLYSVPVLPANAAALSALISEIGGTSVTLDLGIDGQYPEQLPCQVLGSTDYARINASQNYMYQQDGSLTASVFTTSDANTYDALKINYMGQTQSAGVQIAFYQRGQMMGGVDDLLAINVYANEQWLKDAISAELVNLLIALTIIPQNTEGENQIRSAIQSVVSDALDNNVISAGKSLTNVQKSTIASISGDPFAWVSVENDGYWIGVVLSANEATYTLVYSKGDAINKVEGSHDLI